MNIKVIHKPNGRKFMGNKNEGSHPCEITGQGYEFGMKVYDFSCGKWGYECQADFRI